MSNHGNAARAGDVNPRGEATNRALASRLRQHAMPAHGATSSTSPDDKEWAERAERIDAHRNAAAQFSLVANRAAMQARDLEEDARRTRRAQQDAQMAYEDAVAARAREAARINEAFQQTHPPLGEPINFDNPVHIAYLNAQAAAFDTDTAYTQAAAAAREAEERVNAATARWKTLVTQTMRAQQMDRSARFQADRHTALANRVSDPEAQRYAYLTETALAPVRAATTTRAVTDWMRTQFPHVTLALAGVPLDALKAVALELATFAHDHPYAMRELAYLAYANDPAAAEAVKAHGLQDDKSVISAGKELSHLGGQAARAGREIKENGQTTHQAVHGVVFLNSALDSQHPQFRATWDRQVAVQWTGLSHEAYAHGLHPAAWVTRHELGHLAHYTILNRAYGVVGSDPGATPAPESYAADRALVHLADLHDASPATNISHYAAEGDHPGPYSGAYSEHFAEAYAAARYGTEKAMNDPFTQAVMQATEAFS